MIGPVRDINQVLGCEDPPAAVDLYCHEELGDSDDEFEIEVEEVTQPSYPQHYTVVVSCGSCERLLSLTVCCSDPAIRTFQQLLFADCSIICPSCAVTTTRRHG